MIVLDTNVMSELMRREPEHVVLRWLDLQPSQSLWTTAISIFELQVGLERLQFGRRKQALEGGMRRLIDVVLDGRVLPFDLEAANAAATIADRHRVDSQIAGIVASRRAVLATRNPRHFADAGIKLVDPWTDEDR
jgi:predicted nucleic acid-binding protein